ncbi:MAG TPA: L,D-transpeptidase family protein [Hyphomonadaceae bacterium]|nr:L,D-transpeptidase family protein [Hyphomonadaceae bacterium]
MAEIRTPAFEATSHGRLRWQGRDIRCALGRSGVVAAPLKREGDGATPLGDWPMRRVFWRPDRLEKPVSQLPVIALRADMGWCDDPAHPDYNRQVVMPFPASHEKLWRDDDIYDLIVVLGYNDDPVIPGRGSAIFLHLAREDFSPTEGCVACSRDNLLALIRLAKPGDALSVTSAIPQREIDSAAAVR